MLLNMQTPTQTVAHRAMTPGMARYAPTGRFMVSARFFGRSSAGNGRTASSIAAKRPGTDITSSCARSSRPVSQPRTENGRTKRHGSLKELARWAIGRRLSVTDALIRAHAKRLDPPRRLAGHNRHHVFGARGEVIPTEATLTGVNGFRAIRIG